DIYNFDRNRKRILGELTYEYYKKNSRPFKNWLKRIKLFRFFYYRILGQVDAEAQLRKSYLRVQYFCSYILEDYQYFDKEFIHNTKFFNTPFLSIDQYLSGDISL